MESVDQVVADGQIIKVGQMYRNKHGKIITIVDIQVGLTNDELSLSLDLFCTRDARILYIGNNGLINWCRAWGITECHEKVSD